MRTRANEHVRAVSLARVCVVRRQNASARLFFAENFSLHSFFRRENDIKKPTNETTTPYHIFDDGMRETTNRFHRNEKSDDDDDDENDDDDDDDEICESLMDLFM